MPSKGVGGEHVSEETSNVSETIGFVSMDSFVVIHKRLLKQLCPEAVDFCEALSDKTVKLGVCAFLGTTFNNH